MIKTIVIDPGHGGNDPGAVNATAYEKDKVLLIAKELASQLSGFGVNAVLTRTEDIAISIAQRTAIERAASASCCISCHMDAGQPSASGMSVWLHSKAPASYIAWANDTLAEIKKVGYTSNRTVEVNTGFRGDRNLDYGWNRETSSPSMLLELGFITNSANLAEFDRNCKAYARAVAIAACRFIGVQHADIPPTQPTPPPTVPPVVTPPVVPPQSAIDDEKCRECKAQLLREITELLTQ